MTLAFSRTMVLTISALIWGSASSGFAADVGTKFSTDDGSTKLSILNSNGGEVAWVDSDGSASFQRTASPSDFVSYQVSADTATTSAVLGLTGMAFDIGANETWSFEFMLQNGCSNTGGLRWAINGPAGATLLAEVVGTNTTAANLTSEMMTVLNTQTGVYNAASFAAGWTRITGVMVNSSTPGQVTLKFRSQTAGQTTTLKANSYVVARKTLN